MPTGTVAGKRPSDLRGVFDGDQVSEMRDAIEAAAQADRDGVREVAEPFD